MPIYEFYCKACNTIYQFFSRKVNTEKIPDCPKCQDVKLERMVSSFATISGGRDSEAGDDDFPIDESKMQKAMAALANEAGKINEEDPKQAANLMRKFSDAAGIKMGSGMEEALSRMERGEDPDKIVEEMGDLLEGEEPFIETQKKKGGGSKQKPQPTRDETLYDL